MYEAQEFIRLTEISIGGEKEDSSKPEADYASEVLFIEGRKAGEIMALKSFIVFQFKITKQREQP